MRRFMFAVGRALGGAILGLLLAVPSLILLDWAEVTNHVEDEPLRGLIPFLVTLYGCVIAGATIGTWFAWRRARPAT